ncbi:hypothetical protein [Moraxella lacunata]|uniref:hypothetical protein n=1 Tax=Moraxella lacunata TaxID=477 RepID=UPI003EE1CD22
MRGSSPCLLRGRLVRWRLWHCQRYLADDKIKKGRIYRSFCWQKFKGCYPQGTLKLPQTQ